MEIFAIVLLSVILAFIAGKGIFIALNAPNYGGPLAFILGVTMFILACATESVVIESFPQQEKVKVECVKEAK